MQHTVQGDAGSTCSRALVRASHTIDPSCSAAEGENVSNGSLQAVLIVLLSALQCGVAWQQWFGTETTCGHKYGPCGCHTPLLTPVLNSCCSSLCRNCATCSALAGADGLLEGSPDPSMRCSRICADGRLLLPPRPRPACMQTRPCKVLGRRPGVAARFKPLLGCCMLLEAACMVLLSCCVQ